MIEISDHALDSMQERGAVEEEVKLVLEQGQEASARHPRLAREAVFRDGYNWRGRFYPHKLIRVIYAYDGENIVVVTVYVFYGVWEIA